MAMGPVNVPSDGANTADGILMTGYAKPASASAITEEDSVMDAIGKLEAGAGGGSGASGIELADVTDVSATSSNGKISLLWNDPDDLTYNGATLARWVGTTVVRKEGSAPTSQTDGTVVADSTTRDAHVSTPLVDSGLTNGTTYHYRFFPHTAARTYTAGTSVSAIPNKQKATVSVSEDSVTLDSSHLSKTVTITSNSDGTLSAVSSDTSEAVCKVSLSGNTITLEAVDNGTATITISQTDGTDYSAPDPVTVSVTVSLVSPDLDDNDPSTIKDAITAGKASTLWNVGDKVGITLNGTVGKQTFSNQKFYATILGFDHNAETESGGKQSVHFIFGQNDAGTDIAFCDFDGTGWSQGSDPAFRMNLSNTTTGGWKDSYMRKTICEQFLAAMPEEWRNVISETTKYTDNTGGSSTGANQVTATQDKIFLLSEWEVQGARTYANESEKTSQKQYAYYLNGNSKIRKNHRDGSTAVIWWLRSVHATNTTNFCSVSTNGTANYTNASISLGFAPGFAIIAESASA